MDETGRESTIETFLERDIGREPVVC